MAVSIGGQWILFLVLWNFVFVSVFGRFLARLEEEVRDRLVAELVGLRSTPAEFN